MHNSIGKLVSDKEYRVASTDVEPGLLVLEPSHQVVGEVLI